MSSSYVYRWLQFKRTILFRKTEPFPKTAPPGFYAGFKNATPNPKQENEKELDPEEDFFLRISS